MYYLMRAEVTLAITMVVFQNSLKSISIDLSALKFWRYIKQSQNKVFSGPFVTWRAKTYTRNNKIIKSHSEVFVTSTLYWLNFALFDFCNEGNCKWYPYVTQITKASEWIKAIRFTNDIILNKKWDFRNITIFITEIFTVHWNRYIQLPRMHCKNRAFIILTITKSISNLNRNSNSEPFESITLLTYHPLKCKVIISIKKISVQFTVNQVEFFSRLDETRNPFSTPILLCVLWAIDFSSRKPQENSD